MLLSIITPCYNEAQTIRTTLDLRSNDARDEPETAATVLRPGYRIYGVPISHARRASEEGKQIKKFDGLTATPSASARWPASSERPSGRGRRAP
ncbi:MAG: glycosyltransferase [Chloroflexota bacterium]